MTITLETGKWRWVTQFNPRYPMFDPTGLPMVSDTKDPVCFS